MKTNFLFSVVFVIWGSINIFAQGTWTQKANFGGIGRGYAAGFSIGTKGYIGMGYSAGTIIYQDFWEWDQATNIWTQKADFGGPARFGASGFSIGTKGYIGVGVGGTGNTFYNDFWEYDPSNNTWTAKANFPGTPRYEAAGFSIGTKGYIGVGSNGSGTFYQDFYEYNPSNDTWITKASFGAGIGYAASFSIGTKGYIGAGIDASSTYHQDFWEWDQATNTWTQKATFPGTARYVPTGFSIGSKGYIGLGLNYTTTPIFFNDFWEWDQATNIWSRMTNYSGRGLGDDIGFSVGTKGYIGTGFDNSGNVSWNDFWEFSPSSSCNISLAITYTNSACSMATGTASVVATGGTTPYTYAWTNGDITALADTLPSGLYMVTVTDAGGCTGTKAIMISDIGSPSITVTSVTNVSCNGGSNGAITISVAGGSPPYTYGWDNGATTTGISNLSSGPYEFGVMDANGCRAMKSILVTQPAPISLSMNTTNASCGNADGNASVSVAGGTVPYSYLWNNGNTTTAANNLSAGNYFIIVTDHNGCSTASQATIINSGSAWITIDSIISAGCSSGTGAIYITATSGSPPYTYLWSNGATTQNLVGVIPGNYGLTIHGTNSCVEAFNATIPSELPFAPVICIVTVDTGTGKNVCVFEKDSIANLGISQYNFYRETTQAGVYQKLGSQLASLPSAWTDQSANPLQRAWRYKITAVDTCGNESPLSVYHKTVHLAANLGLSNTVNLIWDNYEGFSFSTYAIWRYTPATGWDSLDAVPSNLNSYTDLTPPTLTNLFYFIEVKHPFACAITMHKLPDINSIALNSSRSNVYKINPSTTTSITEVEMASSVQVYPNPSKGIFNVQSFGLKVQSLEVYNMYGEKMYQSNITNPQSTIDISSHPTGIYFLKITSQDGSSAVKKIIKE